MIPIIIFWVSFALVIAGFILGVIGAISDFLGHWPWEAKRREVSDRDGVKAMIDYDQCSRLARGHITPEDVFDGLQLVGVTSDPCGNGICVRTGQNLSDGTGTSSGAIGRCGDCPGLK